MKPRNREISIFNLSMLDVISGALGAFLIIMIVLFRYYDKDIIDCQKKNEEMRKQLQAELKRADAAEQALRSARSEAEQTRRRFREAEQRAAEAEQRAAEAEADAQRNRQRAETAERQLAKTFLVIYIRWDASNQDIDMHVVDPSGAEFFYNKKTIAGRPGELSEDSQVGPGNELWEIHNAPPGEYRVYADLYDPRDETEQPVVKGRVIFRDGSENLSAVRLRYKKDKKLMAVIEVKPDGSVGVR